MSDTAKAIEARSGETGTGSTVGESVGASALRPADGPMTTPPQPKRDESMSERYRHLKRGTEYQVIGTAELQMSADLVDGSELIIYRGDDGKLWAREAGEFHDGRFEQLPSPPTKEGDGA